MNLNVNEQKSSWPKAPNHDGVHQVPEPGAETIPL